MSELTKRILFGVPAAALFLYLVWLGDLAFLAFTTLLSVFILLEMVRLFRKIGTPANEVVSVMIAIFIWVVPFIPTLAAVAGGALLVLITLGFYLSSNQTLAKRWITTLFCGVYAPAGMLLFYLIREIEPNSAGLWLTFALILMIWGNDTFAYFGGKSFGKRPLAPTISPKKTWEGFWSGFAGSLTALGIVFWIADPFPIGFSEALPIIFMVSIFGPAGDLVESRIKRLADVKDSSNILPGHGGFFDRFDALLICCPMVFLYLKMFV